MRTSECIVDVGSASVGVALVETGKEKPVFSMTARVPVGVSTEEAKQSLPALVTQALQKAFESMKGILPPKRVRVVLASPWYDAKIRTIVSKSEKQVRVTTATIARSVKEYLTQKNESTPSAGRTKIEAVVSQAYVNGYPTALKKPILGTALKINYFESEADQSFLGSLTEIVRNAYPHAEISFSSFSLIACLVLRLQRPEDNFIMMDLGGEITDVVIAHHDGLRFIGTFPVGTQSIIRAIATAGSLADTRSRLILHAADELSMEEAATFSKSFTAATTEWNKQYQSLLEEAVKEVAIPQTTFVFADAEELRWLPRLVSGIRGSFSSRPIPITPNTFQSHVELAEGAMYDPFLSLEAIFFHTRQKNSIELS